MFKLELDWDRPAHTGGASRFHTLRIRITPDGSAKAVDGVPLRLALALDVSGSMEGDKLLRAKQACETVVKQLRPQDRFWLAAFSTRVEALMEGAEGNVNAVSLCKSKMAGINASGITRTDLALEWIENSLPIEPEAARIGILITDGHATNARGTALQDPSPIIDRATRMAQHNLSVCTVGLENASEFNTAFLQSICDRSRGWFIYADTPDTLEPQLHERLLVSQMVAVESSRLLVKPLQPQVEADSYCRIRPGYVPLDAPGDGKAVQIGALRADVSTEILLRVSIPPLLNSKQIGQQEVLEVEMQRGALEAPITATATIDYTKSFEQSQRVNADVDRDRLLWNINTYSDELNRTDDPRRTGELLSGIKHSATQANLPDVASQASEALDDLERRNVLDRGTTTGLLADLRKTGKLS